MYMLNHSWSNATSLRHMVYILLLSITLPIIMVKCLISRAIRALIRIINMINILVPITCICEQFYFTTIYSIKKHSLISSSNCISVPRFSLLLNLDINWSIGTCTCHVLSWEICMINQNQIKLNRIVSKYLSTCIICCCMLQ